MAITSNTLTAVVPKLLALGMKALRENAIMPRLVNSSYSSMAGERGSTIDVPIPSAVSAISVTAQSTGVTAPDPGTLIPETHPVALDQWYEAPFALSDKEMLDIMDGVVPMQATAAIRSLANQVDNHIFGKWSRITQLILANGGVPFDPTAAGAADPRSKGMVDITNSMTALNVALCPPEDRRFVIDPISLGNLVQMRAFQDTSWSADPRVVLNAELNQKMGFVWAMDQNLPITGYKTGTFTSAGSEKVNAATAVGATVVPYLTGASTGALNFVVGDVITFTNNTKEFYTITAATGAIGAAAPVNLNIYPGLKTALTTSHVLNFLPTFTGSVAGTAPSPSANTSYKQVIGFHRDAFAFATRPLGGVEAGLGSIVQSAVDPVSGLTLRLEVTREYKRTRFSFDILWGADVVRPELAVRLLYA